MARLTPTKPPGKKPNDHFGLPFLRELFKQAKKIGARGFSLAMLNVGVQSIVLSYSRAFPDNVAGYIQFSVAVLLIFSMLVPVSFMVAINYDEWRKR